MSFGLTQDQQDLRDMVKRFAGRELAPGYLDRARVAEFPWKQHRDLGKLGLLGLLAGPDWGGEQEPDFVSCGLAMEELAYADFNIANCMLPALIITSILREHAPRTMLEEWMPRVVSGETVVALGLTEPGSGSDAGALRTSAVRTSGGWRLSGEKTSITAIPFAEAAVIFARTEPGQGAGGVSAFLVRMDAPGVSTGSIPDPGWLPVGRGTIGLSDVEVAEDALIGKLGDGFRTVMRNFDFTRPLLALTAVGAAQATLDETVEHVRSRTAFGATLSRFEGISFPLAEHATYLELARLISYRA